jgi:serine/threonine protein phosphatase 1
MVHRTFAVGDIHGDLEHLNALLSILPPLDEQDTLLFLGDYMDRGPNSAGVIARLRALPQATSAKVVTLRGNHEDAWIQVLDGGFPQFVLPISNGCLAAYRSFTKGPVPAADEIGLKEELLSMAEGKFLPEDVRQWIRSLPVYYEDEHAVYVHAGLPKKNGRFLHPSELVDPHPILWERSNEFYRDYEGKRVVFGHTMVEILPQDLSTYTPNDSLDVYFGPHVIGMDTRCGHGGFLSAVELPSLKVFESRSILVGK